MVAELSESFLYAQSASDLWKELEERYGQSNGPLIYHDKLHSLNGIPVCNCGKIRECTCGVTEKFLEIDSRSKLILFLMRLNDDFEAVKNQILSMDPLPNHNKAYYTVQQVEKQKQVTHQTTDPTVFFAKGKKNKKGNRMASQVVFDFSSYMAKETPFDSEYENGVQNGKIDLDQRMVAAVCQEVMKMFKGKDSDQSNVASSSKPHVGKLLKTQSLIDIFLPTMFLFHDPSTKKVIAVGEGFNNLYICKPSSSSSIKQSSFSFPSLSSFVNKEFQSKHVASDLFHARLRHTSVS
uniref:Retrovirus-related Pol polyprotein from transposon TNT 1-94 n=1 Tax=Tanacetum cinerariifolium TaxID=118510 RepID=A0A6L2KN18_TANCI|nr:hypothetical protein [Tanacetum cinerariifolium]